MRIYEVHLNEQWRVHFLIIKYWNHTQYAYILPGVKMLSWWILSTSRINKLILTIFSPKINSRLQPCLLFWVNSICWWTPEMFTYYKLHCNYDLLLHFFKKMVLVFCSSILNLSSEYLCDARVTSDCSASFFKAIYNKKQQLIFHSSGLFLPVGGGSEVDKEVESAMQQQAWAAAELSFEFIVLARFPVCSQGSLF